jgi:hypothetical protein
MSASMTEAGAPGTTIGRRVQRPTLAGSKAARIAAALVFATAVTALPVRAVVADQDRRDDRGYERGRGHERGREHHRYRVYAPPPVYYPEVVSPGIRLVIPIEIR